MSKLIVAEIQALHDKIKELEDDLDILRTENMGMMVDSFDYVPIKTHMRLVRRFKELESDKDRLDWLDKEGHYIEATSRTDWHWNVELDGPLREALEAARK